MRSSLVYCKIGGTRYQIFRLKCIKFGASADAGRAPRPNSCINGILLRGETEKKGRKRKEEERKRKGRGRGREGREGCP